MAFTVTSQSNWKAVVDFWRLSSSPHQNRMMFIPPIAYILGKSIYALIFSLLPMCDESTDKLEFYNIGETRSLQSTLYSSHSLLTELNRHLEPFMRWKCFSLSLSLGGHIICVKCSKRHRVVITGRIIESDLLWVHANGVTHYSNSPVVIYGWTGAQDRLKGSQ